MQPLLSAIKLIDSNCNNKYIETSSSIKQYMPESYHECGYRSPMMHMTIYDMTKGQSALYVEQLYEGVT